MNSPVDVDGDDEAAMEAAWERSAVPHPRSCLEAERERISKGHRPDVALRKWGPELEAQIMRDLAEGTE